MKLLTIPEQHDIDIGEYTPACESFISNLKEFFFKDKKKDNVNALKKNTYEVFRKLEENLDSDLKATYDNSKWVEKNLTDSDGFITIAALQRANANMKELHTPADIVKIAETMLTVIKDLAKSEMPFINYRQSLTRELDKMTDNKKADQIWLNNKKALSVSAADRYMQRSKKFYPAFSLTGKEGNTFPVLVKNKTNHLSATGIYKTSGKFISPSTKNAKEFSTAVKRLLEIANELNEVSDTTYIPECDASELEWDELEYGDEIYGMIYSYQQGEDVFEMANDLYWAIGKLIAGLYIAMFDTLSAVKE